MKLSANTYDEIELEHVPVRLATCLLKMLLEKHDPDYEYDPKAESLGRSFDYGIRFYGFANKNPTAPQKVEEYWRFHSNSNSDISTLYEEKPKDWENMQLFFNYGWQNGPVILANFAGPDI